VPSSLLTWSSSHEGQGGIFGVLFMSFTFTLVSFTCTFAFVGLLLPMAAGGSYYWPIFGMLAFSSAFASPFFFLALFPSFLKKLPQSGGWMFRVKVVFGLLELGAAFKFLSVADIGWFSAPYFFDYAVVMTSWMVLCIVAGLYLLGIFRLQHDTQTDSIGVLQLSFAMTFLGFSAYLATGIYGTNPPTGVVWQQIAAFAPQTFESKNDENLGPALMHNELLYALDVDQAIQYAKANNEPMFFDFTGTNCVSCRFMEINVFPKKENHELLEKFVRVQLYTDMVPELSDKKLVEQILNKNRLLQSDWFNDATLPAYAIVMPDGKTILSSYRGAERATGEFTEFLKAGLAEWQRQKLAMKSGAVIR
ncbi:MAG: thioredoxin family protein, partial [Planctomycetaceae bacterium]|nr:thioredoxin family protein [Planctomycetaceae bacterium]